MYQLTQPLQLLRYWLTPLVHQLRQKWNPSQPLLCQDCLLRLHHARCDERDRLSSHTEARLDCIWR